MNIPEQPTAMVRTLLRTAKQIRLGMEVALAEAGGSFATFVILDAVALEPGLSQRGIARRLSIEGPSITRHIDHLEAEGLVERRRDAADRRILRIFATTAGLAHHAALCPIMDALGARLLHAFTPQEQMQMAGLLTRLHAQVSAGEDEG